MKLLMIDDEVNLLSLQKELLEDVFPEIVTCSEPQKAYEICLNTSFDLIICDHKMAEVNGLDLLKILRSEGVMTPFILATGCATKEMAVEALRLGISDLLEKPVEIAELKLSIARTLELEKNRTFFYKTLDPENPDAHGARKHFAQRLGNLLASIKNTKAS